MLTLQVSPFPTVLVGIYPFPGFLLSRLSFERAKKERVLLAGFDSLITRILCPLQPFYVLNFILKMHGVQI